MSVKRPGRYSERPQSDTAKQVVSPPLAAAAAAAERKGAPLPLLTQPMAAINREELGDLAELGVIPSPTAGATPVPGPASQAVAAGSLPEGPGPTAKIELSAIAIGKPTVMMAPQAKPVSGLPQIDLTQHHLLDEKPDPRLALVIDPDSERSAAFRVLRHHLLEHGRPQVVIVSSPQAGDGKTTTAVNLALALAECGRAKTLLVETHVRHPQLTEIFRFVPPWCFAEQLAAHRHQPAMPWSMIDIPQLWLHVAAINPRIAQNQLLDGPAFAIAMERLRLAGYDHIVVDAPPVLGSADVNLMADAADGVVFALRARRSNIRDLRRAIDQLGGKKITGTVLLEDR